MKKTKLLLLCCLAVLLFPMVFGGLLEEPPIPYDPNDIKFSYDPNSVSHKLIGSITIPVDKEFTCDINYYDPDGDMIKVYLLVAPEQMLISSTGPTEYVLYRDDYFGYDWRIGWTPTIGDVGVHYVDIRIEDAPLSEDFLSDTGTLVINVVPKNKPPIIGGCS